MTRRFLSPPPTWLLPCGIQGIFMMMELMRFPLQLILAASALMVTAYLLGAIPWGLILTRRRVDMDIRSQGSGNIGATNVARIAGKPLGALTLILDMLKGAIPVYAAWAWMHADPRTEILMALAGFCAFLGHLFPVYLKFKTGGKGVATALGCFLIISPAACLCSLLGFCIIFWWQRRVSAGSLAAMAMLPGFVFLWTRSWSLTIGALLMTLLIFWRHEANIKRLLRGTEPVFGRAVKKE